MNRPAAPNFPVRFSAPRDGSLMVAVNIRDVFVRGELVGTLYGIHPAPGNPHRPTAFEFWPDNPNWVAPGPFDRLETAREGIARLYGVIPGEAH